MFVFSTAVTIGTSVVYASLTDYVPPEGRGRIIAVEQFISALVGFGLGPTLVALVTDRVLGDENMVNVSMVLVGVVVAAVGFLTAAVALPGTRRLHSRIAADE